MECKLAGLGDEEGFEADDKTEADHLKRQAMAVLPFAQLVWFEFLKTDGKGGGVFRFLFRFLNRTRGSVSCARGRRRQRSNGQGRVGAPSVQMQRCALSGECLQRSWLESIVRAVQVLLRSGKLRIPDQELTGTRCS